MAYELKGKIEVIQETQEISGKFKKREFVIVDEHETEPKYNQFIKFQFVQDKCSLLDNFSIEDIVTVSFNLRGRPYTKDGKTTYFTNLDAWRIQADSGTEQAQEPVGASSDEDDLPF